jgi:hypothetical protein
MVKSLRKFLGACLLCWLCLPLLSSLAWADKVTDSHLYQTIKVITPKAEIYGKG